LLAGQLYAVCGLLANCLGVEIKSTAPSEYPRDTSESSSLGVTKMIGVCSQRFRSRMSAAVAKPSITGMSTSSRITAKSSFIKARSASRPEFTVTTF
jgi:hypothetical protein